MCSTASFSDSRFTAAASRVDSGRRPWSIVTATRRGDGRSFARQRAMRWSSAVESGPPETATTRAGSAARSANRTSASASLTAPSTPRTLQFPLDSLFDARLCARIFPAHVGEGHAGKFLLVQRRQRLAEPQQRVRGFGAVFIPFRQLHEGVGGVLIALALKQALTEIELGLRRQPVGRI